MTSRRAGQRDPQHRGRHVPSQQRSGDPRVKAALAALIVLVLVGGLWAAVRLGQRSTPGPTNAGSTPSSTATTPAPAPRPRAAAGPGQGLVVPPPAGVTATSKGPRIDIYVDPQCPWCKRFHETLKAGFDDLRARGAATLVIHPKSFLDAELGNDSSRRAAQAMACASDAGRLWEFTDAMYAGQPAQEGQGFTDAQLDGFAVAAGVAGPRLSAWRTCTAQHRYAAYIDEVETSSVRDDRVNGTPTFRVDGHDVELSAVLPEGAPPNPQAFFDQVHAP